MTSRRRYLILKNFLSIRSLPNTKWGWCKRLGLVKSQLNKLYRHNKAETYSWKFLKFPSDISSVCQANVNKLCTAIYEAQILNTRKLHIVVNQLPIIKLWKAATYLQLKSCQKDHQSRHTNQSLFLTDSQSSNLFGRSRRRS